MVNKRTVNYHPSPSQLISRILSHISMDSLGVYLTRIFLEFFLNPYIPPWLQKSFKIIVLRLLQIHLWVKKLNLFIFTHDPKQNSPPGFYHYRQADGNIPFLPDSVFWKYFSWGARGRGLSSKNNANINEGIGHKFL